MANETMIANMTFQTGTTAANTFIKVTDLLQILLKDHTNEEIANWVAEGHNTCKEPLIADNKEIAQSFERTLHTAGIPYMRLCYDRNGNRIEPQNLIGKDDLSEMTDKELEKLGDFEVAYVVRDIDEEQAYAILSQIERAQIIDKEQFALSPEALNKHFGSVGTNFIEGMSLDEARLLQKEMSEQRIHTALVKNEAEQNYSLELANVDMHKRTSPDIMTPAETAFSKAIFKMSLPELKEHENFQKSMESSLEKVKVEIVTAFKEDRPLPSRVIYDAANPDKYISFNRNGTIELHHSSAPVKQFSLSDRDSAKMLDAEIARLECPQPMEANAFSKTKESNPKQLMKQYYTMKKYQDFEKAADEVYNELVKNKHMEVKIEEHNPESTLAQYSFGAKEFRIENTDEVREIVGKLKPLTMDIEQTITDAENEAIAEDTPDEFIKKALEGGKQNFDIPLKDELDKFMERAEAHMKKLDITPTKPHVPIAIRYIQIDESEWRDAGSMPTNSIPATTLEGSYGYYTPIEPEGVIDLDKCDVVATKEGILFVDKDDPERVVIDYDVDLEAENEETIIDYGELDTALAEMHEREDDEDLGDFFDDMEPTLGDDWS